MPKRVTLLAIGQTGAGKSELGNAYLERKDKFLASDDPDAVTVETHVESNALHGIERCFIDTQGLDDTQGVDAKHIQQMVLFLRNYPHGVNAVAIVINGQHPRLDTGTQKLIRIIHTFFNNNKFWYQVCLVFTRDFRDNRVNRIVASNKYREKIQEIVVECMGRNEARPQLPAFFVDSKRFDSCKDDFSALHAFIVQWSPLPTRNVVAPDVRFAKSETETRENILVGQKEEACENGSRKILIYENQKREKKTAFDGKTITYTDWRWDGNERRKVIQTKTKKKEIKNKILIKTERKNIYRTEDDDGGHHYNPGLGAAGAAAGLIFGPIGGVLGGLLGFGGKRESSTHEVLDHVEVTRIYQDQEREVIKNYDNSTTYGEWRVIREYTENSQEPPN
jgi:predicted GTPase